jgi:hypothetical protein
MAQNQNSDLRLARLERIGCALILERHGIGQAGVNFTDVIELKRQAIRDSAAILNEFTAAQPRLETAVQAPMETRGAA